MKKGYSLVEILVVAGLLALVVGLVLSMSNTSNLSWDTHNIQLELQQKARFGIEKMVEELYQVSSSNITVAGNITTFKIPVIVPPDTDIYNDTTGDVTWGAEGNVSRSIRYRNVSNQLVREIINDATSVVMSTQVCANNVTAMVLVPTPSSFPETLNINITCSKPLRPGAGATNITTNLESQVTFRN